MEGMAARQEYDRAQVASRWAGEGDGQHYAGPRWKNARAAGRDGALLARLLQDEPLGAGRSALDAPSGTGRLTPTLTSLGWRAVSLDHSRSMLLELGSQATQASAFALPFADRAFDLVVCCRLIHHLSSPVDRAALIRELARVSSRAVALSHWDPRSWHGLRRQWGLRGGHDHRVCLPWDELRTLATDHGLRIVRSVHSLRFVSMQTWSLLVREEHR